MPKVTVISPAFNHEKYIGLAISSVLNQTFSDFEYIISDDASTDNTVMEIEKFNDPRIIFLRNEINGGTSLNSKRAWCRSNGKYIMALTTDDIYKPEALEYLTSYLDDNPETQAVFAQAELIDEAGTVTGKWTEEGVGLGSKQLLNRIFFQQPVLCAPTMMVRREVFDRHGYFPPNFKQINDIALWIKVFFSSTVAVLPVTVLQFRIRDNQANTSAPTEKALTRFAFEITEVLMEFERHIQSMEQLLSIFPEVHKQPWPKVDELTHFHLAHLALSFDHASYRYFGIKLLHKLFSEASAAENIRILTGFGFKELFELTGNLEIFFEPSLLARYKHLQRQASEQQLQLAELNKYHNALKQHCQHLETQNNELLSSDCWRVTAPIRKLKSILQRLWL